MMKQTLELLKNNTDLSIEQMVEAMNIIMDGKASNDEMRDFLTLLADKGETTAEITGAAKVMREKASTINAPYGAVDCCGTGGDNSGSYNISTAVAFVAAACGVTLAKHGNRSASSKSGAADVLEVLGVNLTPPLSIIETALERVNFAFLMATQHHQAMSHIAPVRKALGRRTIFNLLGPLANPAGTKYQLIGVYDRAWLVPMAETLRNLGSKGAWIVYGSDGMDEITTTGETYVAKLDYEGNITEEVLTPADFGIDTLDDPEKLKGGDAETNAKALRALLEGQKCAYRDIVLANAAAVLCIAGKAESLKDGVSMAAEAIDLGFAKEVLHDYIAFSRKTEESLRA